ncbi:sigma factor [Trinickia violacea]|uniref:sigma factor n=1 Tax=Trinickia violacea TaxID=2571746 RepID=UPI0026A1FB03
MGVAETAEAVARASYGKLVAFLAARTRDVAGAEDALADAFAAALADWPHSGIPRVPEAWLLTVARRKLIDAARHRRVSDEATPTLMLLASEFDESGDDAAALIPDDRLRLMFACAHPAIDAGVRAPLILQTVLGFDAVAIGAAFLVAPATMGQRLVRAKSRIRQTGIPFRVPDDRDQLAERLDAVLEAIYAIYAEGWSDPAGTQAHSRGLALCADRLSGGGDQSCRRAGVANRWGARRARGPRCTRRIERRQASCRLSTLLGGPGRAAREDRRLGGRGRRLPAGDRARIRSCRAALSTDAACQARAGVRRLRRCRRHGST